ncbi:MAG: ORF6N domain-containing protein [Betaproteobacteria bacterium]
MDIDQLPGIETRIQVMRGIKVMVDADLAKLYGVTTKRLNEQVKRNRARFPGDFMFQLSEAEKAEVVANCDHLRKLKFSKSLPHAFTEHGAIQAANVLASPQAIEMGIHVVRAFVRLRAMAATHGELSRRLDELERTTAALATRHNALGHATQAQLQQVFDALRQLTTLPDPPARPIGFV